MMASWTTPTTNDIVLGRGKTYHYHRGNQRFRAIIAVHMPQYADEKATRLRKTKIVEGIVDSLYKDGCRFLKQDRKTFVWYDVGFHKAKAKVGHALRDAISEMHRSLARAAVIRSQKITRALPPRVRTKKKATSIIAPNSFESQSEMNATFDLHEGVILSEKNNRKASSPGAAAVQNLKMNEFSSGDDSSESDIGGLFPASSIQDYSKFADIEPTSIASIALSSQPELTADLHGSINEDESTGSIVGNTFKKEEADFFSSLLDMLNQASSVIREEDSS